MAYSQVGIVNLALQRIGVKRIASMTEQSKQAIDANAAWEYIRDEVLEAAEWRFAKTRVALAKNVLSPAYGYEYAYTLPVDFLRLCRQKEGDPPVYPTGAYASTYVQGQLQVQGINYGYALETLSDGTEVLVTDYDNSSYDLFIAYIRKVADPTKFSAHFINALAFRLAAELAITLTEERNKFADMMTSYDIALVRAEALEESGDYIDDETGSNDWLYAGR